MIDTPRDRDDGWDESNAEMIDAPWEWDDGRIKPPPSLTGGAWRRAPKTIQQPIAHAQEDDQLPSAISTPMMRARPARGGAAGSRRRSRRR